MGNAKNQYIKTLYVAALSLVLFVGLWIFLIIDPVIASGANPQTLGKHVGSWWDEDSYFEYLTAAFAFLAACAWVWAIRRARAMHILVQRRDFIFPAIFVLLMVLLAGEEISWGQRIIGVATPSLMEEINTQNEITLHNIKSPINIMIMLYLGTITWGGIFPFLRQLSRPARQLFWVTKIPIPPIYCTTLFFVAPLFRIAFIGDYGNYAREGMEVIISAAFLVAALSVALEPDKGWWRSAGEVGRDPASGEAVR